MLRDIPNTYQAQLLDEFMLTAFAGGARFDGQDSSVSFGAVNQVMANVIGRYDTIEVKFTHPTQFEATTRVELRFAGSPARRFLSQSQTWSANNQMKTDRITISEPLTEPPTSLTVWWLNVNPATRPRVVLSEVNLLDLTLTPEEILSDTINKINASLRGDILPRDSGGGVGNLMASLDNIQSIYARNTVVPQFIFKTSTLGFGSINNVPWGAYFIYISDFTASSQVVNITQENCPDHTLTYELKNAYRSTLGIGGTTSPTTILTDARRGGGSSYNFGNNTLVLIQL